MNEVFGTIFVIVGLLLCVISSALFYLSFKVKKETDVKNKERAIKGAETRKKNKKEKEEIIKKSNK